MRIKMLRLKNGKKIISFMLCLLMVFSLVGCSSADKVGADKGNRMKAGTYTAKVEGHNGEITVEITVDEEKITDIKVVEHNETKGVADLPIEKIPKEIVEKQSVAVDTVAGATVTSKALIAAVIEGIKQAGGDVEAFSVKKADDVSVAENIEKTTDVVVVGAGGAGLAAAVSAHQNGANVIVIEKMPKIGGNTIIAGSAYNAVDPKRQEPLGIEDSVDKHFQQTYEGGDKAGNPKLIRILVENAYSGIEWLESLGMEFSDTVFTVLGALWPRSHKPVKPLGTGYIDAYKSYIDANGIEIMLETTAEELIVENGRVIGVKAKGATGNDVILKANNGVIMATGGFGANVEMRQKYDSKLTENIRTTNHPGATGEGLLIAEKAGANLIGMEYIQLLPMGDPKTGSLSGNIETIVENRIFINKEGNRFVAEDERRDVMTNALFEQPDQQLWVIVDKHSYPTGDTKNNFNETIDELVEQGRAYKGDTLEELAAQIGVDPTNLVNSVEKFNQAVEKKGEDEFGRKLFKDKIDTAPFYAASRVPTVHHTMGGIAINTKAQAIDKDGNIIPGLYAAGEATGGIHGTNRLGGNALADTVVFGRIAGASAANNK